MASASGEEARATAAWRNWAGDQVCTPFERLRPASREELADGIVAAAAAGRKISVAASGHSFTETAMTEGTMIDAGQLSGVIDIDGSSGLVKVGAGTVLADLNEQLHGLGLAMENLGDIDRQTIAGAISTGTHGTGAKLRNISSQVVAMELVLADGSLRELTAEGDPELLRAARVSIGALGAIYSVTLRCTPAFTLHRIDSPHPREEVLDSFQDRADAHEHFELFTFPYADSALVLERNRTEGPPRPRGRTAAFLNDIVLENWALEAISAAGKAVPRAIPSLSRLAAWLASGSTSVDRSDRIFANERRVRFTEMEYGVPREHGPEAARRVIDWVRSNRYPVFFPIEMRVTAGDDALLSPSHERDTAYIAVHQYRGMEWRPYFEAVEAIMDEYGGRPHWGKRHFQTAATLVERYPRWADFQAARDELDPGHAFTNEYAERVLGP
ncbi:MAG: L-gulono,4-lactone dehydrogenase [Solirubrobacterales bacterium]|jgi:L-gulonolactone oxidase|nr:L-gulono,4-lactone dehydrogenase [Solirubrobacterales bacterium]